MITTATRTATEIYSEIVDEGSMIEVFVLLAETGTSLAAPPVELKHISILRSGSDETNYRWAMECADDEVAREIRRRESVGAA